MMFLTKKRAAIICLAAAALLIFYAALHPKSESVSAEIPPNALQCVMYHHVLGKNNKLLGDYAITKAELEADLAWLAAAGYNSVSPSEIIESVKGGAPLPKKPVLITFDDGYESFFANALPVLEKYNAKATVSVIGRYSQLYSDPVEPKNLNYSHINWQQLAEIKENPLVTIGSHSYDMHDATGKKSHSGAKRRKSESDEQYKEFFSADTQKLQEALSQNVGVQPNVYAYPFGYYSDLSEEILKQMGFEMTLGCEEGQTVLTSDPSCLYLIKRYNRPHGTSSAQFFAKMGMK